MRDFYLPHIISRTRAQVAYTVDPKKIVKVHGNFFFSIYLLCVMCSWPIFFSCNFTHFLVVLGVGSKNAISFFFMERSSQRADMCIILFICISKLNRNHS